MKEILRTLIALSIALLAGRAMAVGNHPTVIETKLSDDGKVVITEKAPTDHQEISNGYRLPMQKEGEEIRYTVTPKYIYNEEEGIAPGNAQWAVCEDGSDAYSYFEINGHVLSPWNLPAGTYNFVFRFTSPDGMLILYKGGVEVNSDMEIEAIAADAKVNYIEWHAYMPDGSVPLLSKEDNDSWCYPMGTTYIACQNYLLYECGFELVKAEYGDLQKENNIWTNAPETCSFSQVVCVADKKGNYYIEMPAIDTQTQSVSNDINLYNVYRLNLPENMGAITNGLDVSKAINLTWNYCWEDYSVTFRTGIKDINYNSSHIDYYYCGYANKVDSYLGKLFPCPSIITSDIDWQKAGIEPPILKMTTTDFQFQDNRQSTIPNTYFFTAYNKFGVNNDTLERPVFNPHLALPKNFNPIFGDGTPIVIFTRPYEEFDYVYIGRYGEARSMDYLNQKFAIYLNGEKVWTDYFDMNGFYRDENWQPGIAYEKGVWEYEIEDSNLVLDGLSTISKCFMHFEDNDTESFTWPTLTALQFRNMDDEITDRFVEAIDGRVILTGGIWANVDYQYFDCSTAEEFKVEYSPYQTDDFSPLSVEIDPEKRFMPVYGDYYEGSLNQVTKESDTKWYDLRVTIKDAKGNYQQQTISPAFKIENVTTGIKNTDCEDNLLNIYVKSNSIIAPSGSYIYTYDGRKVSGDNLSQGIYIVRCGNKTAKVVIK